MDDRIWFLVSLNLLGLTHIWLRFFIRWWGNGAQAKRAPLFFGPTMHVFHMLHYLTFFGLEFLFVFIHFLVFFFGLHDLISYGNWIFKVSFVSTFRNNLHLTVQMKQRYKINPKTTANYSDYDATSQLSCQDLG